MPDLYDGITPQGPDGTISIPSHALGAALRELSRGAVTKAQIVSAFGLDSTQEANIDAIIAEYQSKPNAQQKAEYVVKIHDVFILSESGFYTKAKAKSELGF